MQWRMNSGTRRPSARKRGYSPRWEAARASYLRKHPWCVMCEQRGEKVKATVVDHIRPHRGDMRLFWDSSNWQGLCATHHNSAKQRDEKRGVVGGCDERGLPIDGEHHWS